MPTQNIQSLAARRLAAALKQLREDAKKSQQDVSDALAGDIAANTISQIETGKRPVTRQNLHLLLNAYGVTGDEREALRELAAQAREPGWWQRYPADVLPTWAHGYIGLEAEAVSIRTWELGFVPGLLQTEDYCREIMAAAPAAGNAETITRKIELRMQRQARLKTDGGPEFWFVVDESVIHRTVGTPSEMREQLLHIVDMADRPNITIQVVEREAGPHQGLDGSFTHLIFSSSPDSDPTSQYPDVAYIEYQMGSLYLEASADVARYRTVFDHLVAKALGPGKSVDLIKEAAARLS